MINYDHNVPRLVKIVGEKSLPEIRNRVGYFLGFEQTNEVRTIGVGNTESFYVTMAIIDLSDRVCAVNIKDFIFIDGLHEALIRAEEETSNTNDAK